MSHRAVLVLAALVSSALLASTAHAFIGDWFRKYVPPTHAKDVLVVDRSQKGLPKVRLGERVIDLMSGMHFDNLLQDTPDELRPPSLVLFDGHKSCPYADSELGFTKAAEQELPSRERLMIARYDIDSAPVRGWFDFTPEMDLQKRMGVTQCGTLVFVPRSCDGFTKWCEHPRDPKDDPMITKVGCENFKDHCGPDLVKRYDPSKDGKDWKAWVKRLAEKEGEPEISPVFGSYADQKRWILDRDETTTDNEMRNYYLVEAFPAFTNLGFQAAPIPKKMDDFLRDFYARRKGRNRVTESWHAGSTQMSFHDVPTTFVSLDQEGHIRDQLANEVIKPIVEKWSGISPLELTSFYGIREYKNQSWLRNHVDRIDTHVLSVTFNLGKLDRETADRILTPEEEALDNAWPLEGVAFDGKIYRHNHTGGTMLLYESSKLAHGRPYKNMGPDHLGVFCHFKPVSANADDALRWDNIASNARLHQQANGVRGTYRSVNSVEPDTPKYSTKSYGIKTGFRSKASKLKGHDRESDDDDANAPYDITLINDSDRTLSVSWVSPTGEKRDQGTIGVGASLRIGSYLGHKFVWLEDDGKVAPRGAFTVEAGSRNYRYSTKRGAHKTKATA